MTTTASIPQHAYRVLFVCMGNICRSPTAHGVFESMVKQAGLADLVQVDSAGTHNYHVGSPPDVRSQEHALKRGHDLSRQRARQLTLQDFAVFDLVVAMDGDNLTVAQERCRPEQRQKVRSLAEFFQHHDTPEVPDPYLRGPKVFEKVLDLVEDGCAGLLRHVQQQLKKRS